MKQQNSVHFFFYTTEPPIFPLDNVLKPRQKYNGESVHKIALEIQHKAFSLVHNNIKASKSKQNRRANKDRIPIELHVGDAVFNRNNLRTSKLQNKWSPYYRIIKQTGPLSFIIKNQLDNSTTKAHARHLLKTNITDWQVPKPDETLRPTRQTTFVVPPRKQIQTILIVHQAQMIHN